MLPDGDDASEMLRNASDDVDETPLPDGDEEFLDRLDRAVASGGEARQSEVSSRNGGVDAAESVTAARNATRPTQPDVPAPTYAERTENIERLMQSMRFMARNGAQTARIELSPPELGHVELHVTVENGVANATLRAESSEAQRLLLANAEQLRQHMEAQGVELGGFDVFVDHGDSGPHEEMLDGRPRRRRRDRSAAVEDAPPPDADPLPPGRRTVNTIA